MKTIIVAIILSSIFIMFLSIIVLGTIDAAFDPWDIRCDWLEVC